MGMTAHMMFVGFSMTDANFMRLIDSVMAAYGEKKREGAGTIVNLATPKQEMVDTFGEYGIATETAGAGYLFEPYDVNNPYNTNASREIEVFYDYLLLECTDTAYPIFEDKFETALSYHERVLRDHMDKFLTDTPAHAMKAPAWEKVKKLYKGLGSTRPQLKADPRVVRQRWLKCKDHYTHMIGLRESAEQSQVTSQLSKTVDVEPDENCQYLVTTVSLSDGCKMDAALVMPDTPEGFVGCLDCGEDDRECIARQTDLLPDLIKEFNRTEAAADELMAVAHFLVKAADIEAELQKTVTRYELMQGEPGTVYFLEDYPTGVDAHNKTVSNRVLCWCERNGLLKVEIKKFKTKESRDKAFTKLWREAQRVAEQLQSSPSLSPCKAGAAPEAIQ